MTVTPEERARRSAAAMGENDHASRMLGLTLVSVTPGRAEMTLTVETKHTNGHGICHGGVIFTLADTAFAYACNSYNQSTLAQHNTISFIAPGELGDTLTATAVEVSKTRRSGIYDVRVARGDGTVVAEMRGCSRTIKGQNFEEDAR